MLLFGNQIFLFTLLFALPTMVFCWDDEDYLLFDMISALRKATNDPKADFYSVLEVSPSATVSEITKAHRKKSFEFHPDKNPSEEAEKLYKLLTSINSLLKDEKQRALYDSHLKKGFPVWRGNGYFYNRYQPGILSVIVILLLVVSATQYISAWFLYFRAKQDEKAAAESVNKLTFAQVKKQLKKKGASDSPKLSKRDFKNAGSPAELLNATLPAAQPPQLTELAIVKAPLFVYSKILGLVSKTETLSSAAKKQD